LFEFYVQYQYVDDGHLGCRAGLSAPFSASLAAEKDGEMTKARLGEDLSFNRGRE
jgi:hypothetical protein